MVRTPDKTALISAIRKTTDLPAEQSAQPRIAKPDPHDNHRIRRRRRAGALLDAASTSGTLTSDRPAQRMTLISEAMAPNCSPADAFGCRRLRGV